MKKVVIVNILFIDTNLLTSEQLGTLVEELKKEFKVLYVLLVAVSKQILSES